MSSCGDSSAGRAGRPPESLRRTLALELGYHLLVIDRATGSIIADSERRQLPIHDPCILEPGPVDEARFAERNRVKLLEVGERDVQAMYRAPLGTNLRALRSRAV